MNNEIIYAVLDSLLPIDAALFNEKEHTLKFHLKDMFSYQYSTNDLNEFELGDFDLQFIDTLL